MKQKSKGYGPLLTIDDIVHIPSISLLLMQDKRTDPIYFFVVITCLYYIVQQSYCIAGRPLIRALIFRNADTHTLNRITFLRQTDPVMKKEISDGRNRQSQFIFHFPIYHYT